MYLTSFTGTIVVVFITPTQLSEHGALKSWLASSAFKELSSNRVAMLGPGDSVFIPPGWVPLWLALPTDVDLTQVRPQLAERGRKAQGAQQPKTLYTETQTVIMNLCVEANAPNELPTATANAISAAHVLSASLFPKAISKVAGIAEYFKAMSPPISPVDGDGA